MISLQENISMTKWIVMKVINSPDNVYLVIGTYISAKGDVITGQWRNNMKHGKVKIKYHNGESYVGDYRNNKKHGRGIYVYANTESYTGEYRNGKKHGQGIYRFINGQEKRGSWSEDILVENPLSGHGISLSRSISMKSICNEQIDEGISNDDEMSVSSSILVQTSRESLINLLGNSSKSPQRYRKNTYLSASPNRTRSSSDGSDVSITPLHRRSPLRPKL